MSALIAGFGAELRGDDGVGLAVVRRIAERPLPDGVRAVEIGIGGIALVHELLAGCDRLVIVDGVRRGGAPGTVYVLMPILEDGSHVAETLAASHFTEPYRALVLARQMGALPSEVHVVGIEVDHTEDLSLELTLPVARAVAIAAERALALAAGLSAARRADG